MEKFYAKVIEKRKTILVLFIICLAISLLSQQFVGVNYDMNAYLPEDSHSTVSLEVMEAEFEGAIPNARIMIRGVTLPQALEYKARLEAVDGVVDVMWLDDSIELKQPLEMADSETIENYYKDGNALYMVAVDETRAVEVIAAIRELIGEENAMTGSAVSTAVSTTGTVAEIRKITIFAVIFVLVVLALTTNSWMEPLVVLTGLGVAILLNGGSNLIFGEISFVTNAAGSILQLAVSLDYSVFLLHRFEECRKEVDSPKEAMKLALVKSTSSILSSGITTVIGFLALVLMRFKIGPDLGLALAKGILISLITVFFFMSGWILMTFKWMDKTRHKNLMPSFVGTGKMIRKLTPFLGLIFVLAIVPAYLASIHNDYYYGSSQIYGEGTKLGEDTDAIESIFGKNDTYVLLVPRGDKVLETGLVRELKELSQITGVVAFVEQAGAEIPYEYVDAATLAQLESDNYSRIVLSAEVDYEGTETTALVEKVHQLAEKYYPGSYYLAGEGISTYDLMNTITADNVKVNLVAVGAVFLVLLITMKTLTLPIILVLTIETAIWLNLGLPYFQGQPLFYIAYLIISSVQLGATVDYAILFTDRYKENREALGKGESVVITVSQVTVSILTSGSALTVVGFLLSKFSSNGLLSQLGLLLGKGTLFSLFAVFFVLPGFLMLLDRLFIKKRKNIRGE
ncbi:MAG: RND family transporter [Lachnospiraceae bacterium]